MTSTPDEGPTTTAAPAGPLDRLRALGAPLRIRDVRLLWAAKVSSEVGDWVARLALGVLVLERTGSASATALVTVVSLLPWLGIGQWLSTYADRVPYRNVMVASDIARLALFLVLAWVPAPTWVVLLIAFLAACTTPPFESARAAALPQAAGDRYGAALALFNATYQTGLLVGFAAGGVLVAVVGASWALTLNAATFALSGLIVSRLSPLRSAATDASSGSRLRTAAGVLWHDLLLRRSLLVLFLAGGSTIVAEALVVVVADGLAADLDAGPAGIGVPAAVLAGLLAAAVPLGALIATVVLPSEGAHDRLVRAGSRATITLSAATAALLAGAIAAPHTTGPVAAAVLTPLLTLLAFTTTGALSSITIPFGAVLGARLPSAARASAFSLAQGGLMSASGVFALLGGLLADAYGSLPAVLALTVPGLLVAVYVLARTTGPVPDPGPDPVRTAAPGSPTPPA